MLNHIVIMGRLARDPELRHTQAGIPVATFRLAVDRDFKDKTTGERQTDWIDVVAWRGTGEFVCRYFAKGRMAVVDGRLQMREWTDKEGNKRTTAEVVAENVYFGDSKREGDTGYSAGTYSPAGGSYGGGSGGYGGSTGNYGGSAGSYGGSTGGYGSGAAGGYGKPAPSGYGTPPAESDQFSNLTEDDSDMPF